MRSEMRNEKNCLLYYADHARNTLYVDSDSMKRAGQIDSPEFAEFQRIRKEVHDYKIEVKDFPKTKKRTYGGLTMRAMQAFIILHEGKEKAEAKLRELNAQKAVGMVKGSGYGRAKSWFLEHYGKAYNGSDLSKNESKREKFINELLASVDSVYIDPKGALEGGVSNG